MEFATQSKMKVFVKARPKSKEEKIEKIDENHFVISVKELPERGKVNEALRKKLADYFNVPLSHVILKTGFSARNKIFEIKI